jgi:single-stranded DNA-specific DHH superfamily exonuclease
MKYLIGSKKDFLNFLKDIEKKDKIAILSHNDLDGLASALFLEKILATKRLKAGFLEFLGHSSGVLKRIGKELKKKTISKVFLLDFSADLGHVQDFEKFREEFDVFLIDHHPINPDVKDNKNMIKTKTEDCTALVLYDIAKKFFNVEELDWLICATLISEWSYKDAKNLKFLQKKYPGITLENMWEFEPGKIDMQIGAGIRYYKDLKTVYEMIKSKKLKGLDKIQKIIDEEIEKSIKEYKKKVKFYPEKNLYFAYFSPKFSLSGTVITLLSKKEPDKTFVLAADRDDGSVRLNFRNQEGGEDMIALAKKNVKGLKDSVSGGHFCAAGGSIRKQDVEKFKENLLKD